MRRLRCDFCACRWQEEVSDDALCVTCPRCFFVMDAAQGPEGKRLKELAAGLAARHKKELSESLRKIIEEKFQPQDSD